MTYMAYANDRADAAQEVETGAGDRQPDPYDLYLAQHREFAMSIYDRHSDGSGCCYSTRLRPITNMRPQYRMWIVNAPRHFAADLYLIDWFETKGLAYDVVTDEDLHHGGHALLAPYRVVVTGTHPEYWTSAMRRAVEEFLAGGGRLMYLGGNGFYWVTSVDPERPHVIEVRRGNAGSRAWNSEAGECYHSTSGELGGLWLHRGLPPNRLVGIGFSSMGWDAHAPGYVRRTESFDPRAEFIFQGVAPDEVIGDFGLVMGGAAGDELDRFDASLGSPRHALVLASSAGHSDYYQPVIEDYLQINANLRKAGERNIHADMVFFETPNGGAVFSVGSICWCGSLSHNHYDNNVSRITENVLRKFMA
jgi:N,N-dimethylformamidase